MWATLPRDPTTPSAIPFGNILLPAFWCANRAITKSTTKRAFKRLRKKVESQVRVPGLGFQKKKKPYGLAGSGAYRFSMQESQNTFRHRTPELTTVQCILGLRVEHLQ